MFGSRTVRSADKQSTGGTELNSMSTSSAEASHIADLESQVMTLRDVSQGIGNAIRESATLISDVSRGVDTAAGLVRSTTRKVRSIISAGGTGGHLCYMTLFVFGAFFLMWILFL